MLQVFDGTKLIVKRDRQIVVRDTSTIVDPVFVSREKQIAAFIRSGERLRAYRSSYEYPDGNVPDGVEVDPTSVIGFDLADASALFASLQRKQAEAASAAKQQQARAGSADPEVHESKQDEEK